jgi:hypothetical protein
MTLPSNLGLVFGEILLICFGTKIGHWKWTLTGSVTIMVFFGALLGLGTPDRKGLMMAMVFLSQMGFGWAQMLSITFIQFGVPQVELGISGGLAGVSRYAGGAIAIGVYSTIRECFHYFCKVRMLKEPQLQTSSLHMPQSLSPRPPQQLASQYPPWLTFSPLYLSERRHSQRFLASPQLS